MSEPAYRRYRPLSTIAGLILTGVVIHEMRKSGYVGSVASHVVAIPVALVLSVLSCDVALAILTRGMDEGQ